MARSIIQNDAKMQRKYFNEMLDFYGIPAQYFQCKPGKKYNSVGEMKDCFFDPIRTKVLFDQVPSIKTLKKLGWVTELDQQQPLVHVKYDLPGIEQGCVFSIKDPLKENEGRLFRITKMSMGIIYPANITCQIVAILGQNPEATTDPYSGPHSIFLEKPTGVD